MQRWKRFEYRIKYFLENLGFKANRVPVSGISKLVKGDIIAKKGDLEIIIDAKSTTNKEKIIIDLKNLEKLKKFSKGKIPILVFSFWRHRYLYGIVEESYIRSYIENTVSKECRRYVTLTKDILEEISESSSCMELNSKGKKYILMELKNLINVIKEGSVEHDRGQD